MSDSRENSVPTLSVVISTYGREQVLVETLRSLLGLADRGEELLVVDQTPVHDTATTAFLENANAAGRLRWIRHAPPGTVGAFNRGLVEATRDIILFLDDDIVPTPELVAAHRQVYASHPDAWAAVGQVIQPEDGGPGPVVAGPARSNRPTPPALVRDLDFKFNGTEPAWVENVIACNLSVRRKQALIVGGFDANFIPPVSFRFETEFAKRLVAAGGKIRFEPAASIRHLRAGTGGTRSTGSHLASASPVHGVGDYYYALQAGKGWDRLRYMLRRPFREVRTKFHLRHPWWIPVKFIGELRALRLALRLHRAGPKRLATKDTSEHG